MQRILANGITDKQMLDSGGMSADNNDFLDTGHAPHILESRQPGSNVLNLQNPPKLSNNTADRHVNCDNGIKNESQRTTKRQRSASPPCTSILRHTSTSPLLHSKDGQGRREIIDHGAAYKSGGGGSWSKQRKVSIAQVGRIVPNSDRKQSQRCPLPISEEYEHNRTFGSFSCTTRSTLVSESAPLIEPEVRPQMINADQDWEVRQIIGKEDINGVLHYLVDWRPTLLPEHSLGHAEELVNKFKARLRAQCKPKNKRGRRAAVNADTPTGQEKKKPRGRPRNLVKGDG